MSIINHENNIICIAGASGFIGKSIALFLKTNGYKIKPIGRDDFKKGSEHIASIINGSAALINTVGAPIQGRWTKEFKEDIYQSRIVCTRILVDAIKRTNQKPLVFITSSAVGIYSSNDIHDEYSDKFSSTYLGKVCRDWEREAYNVANDKQVRLVIFRFGIVLGKTGGAFPRLKNIFNSFIGGRIGDGHQWFPYIHIDDVLSAIWFVLVNKNAQGVYNLVVPNLISYDRFCRILAKIINRPYWLNVPDFALKLMYGEGALVLTSGQHVKPHRLIKEGFYFQYPTAIKTIRALTDKK